MTTIAWDGKTLAADRAGTSAGWHMANTTKAFKRKDGCLIGISGNLPTCAAYVRWFLKGEKGKAPTLGAMDDKDDYSCLLIIRKDGTVEKHDKYGWYSMTAPVSIGTGSPVATGIMKLGHSAIVAVNIASEVDDSTGGGVDSVELS